MHQFCRVAAPFEVLTSEDLDCAAEVAKEVDAFVLSDEIYSRFCKTVIVLWGFSAWVGLGRLAADGAEVATIRCFWDSLLVDHPYISQPFVNG